MRRRIAALLLALVAFCGIAVAAPAPAAAAPTGIISTGIEYECKATTGMLGTFLKSTGIVKKDFCHAVGEAAAKQVNKAWKAVRDSLLGDVINSAADLARSALKKALTVSLMGPSLDLNATKLWSGDATLAGMLTWLGLVIATFGLMWQIGKMAITGQLKHAGRAASGWVENVLISALGVGLVALLLSAGDALTTGLVNGTFNNMDEALKRIMVVMIPAAIANPITLLAVVGVVLLVGAIQLVMIFLRQSAIPIQCLLLPVAGAGRVGGDATRQWAPKLITSICMVICYKPMLAIIICTGFAEFGSAHSVVEWLRGCATLVLAVLAPGPLMKIFAPFGAAVGGGMAGGGAIGALGGAVGYMTSKAADASAETGSAGGSDEPTSPVQHAQMVNQTMGKQGGGDGPDGSDGSGGGRGQDVQAHASRTDASAAQTAEVPAQAGPEMATGASTGTASATAGQAAGAAVGTAALGVGVAIEVIDGVNQAIQDAAGEIGNGGSGQ